MNLHQAIEKYNTDEVIKLIKKVTDINGIDGYRRTPLHIAVRKNNTEIVKLLLNKGANVDAVDIFGHTSLHYASTWGYIKIINFLLERGADIEAKINSKYSTIPKYTPMHLAVYQKKTEIVDYLLERGADIEAKDDHQFTPLHLAAYRNYKKIVNFLIDRGADIEAKAKLQFTPLHLATKAGNYGIANILLNNGANIHAVDEKGRTILHLAAKSKAKNFKEKFYILGYINDLISKGADINAIDVYGNTPLHMAINFGFTDMVNLLIEKGAEINTVNSNGCNPFISYMERIKEDSTEPEAIDALDKKKVEIALNLMTGNKEFFDLKRHKNDGVKFTNSYLIQKYKIATADVNEKTGFRESNKDLFNFKVKSRAQKQSGNKAIKECNRALLNMETTERAKEILKIKIGYLKYGVKDAYVKTVILSRGLRELELNIIKNIIKYAGFCESDIGLEHIVQFNNPLSSRAIVSNNTGRNIYNTDSNLGQNIVSYNDCTNVGCNIS